MKFEIIKDIWFGLWPPEHPESESAEAAARHVAWRRGIFSAVMFIMAILAYFTITYATTKEVSSRLDGAVIPLSRQLEQLSTSAALTGAKIDALSDQMKRRQADDLAARVLEMHTHACTSRTRDGRAYFYSRESELAARYRRLTGSDFNVPPCSAL